MDTKKVQGKINNLKRQKNIQDFVIDRIEKALEVGKTKLTFRRISDVMVQKLKNQKFDVEVIPYKEREFSDKFKAIVSWSNLVG